MIPIRMSGSIIAGLPESRRSRRAAAGQQATLTVAAAVVEPNVWNRDGHQALNGQYQALAVLKWLL